ncbi:hypothetical protein [Lysobacter gummosus]|uniref:hypothetical protein n=1 Tax=Lysobacter gummosus TaxID=262324 RepID=UPI00363D4DCB
MAYRYIVYVIPISSFPCRLYDTQGKAAADRAIQAMRVAVADSGFTQPGRSAAAPARVRARCRCDRPGRVPSIADPRRSPAPPSLRGPARPPHARTTPESRPPSNPSDR